MSKGKNILLVGVGGQGTILASKILAQVALSQGLDVKMSEVHGMAQRGGSVVTQVKMGDKVHSPLVEKGEADFIVAFEQLEALRWLPYLKKDGRFVVNTQKIEPMPVIIGLQKYPEDIQGELSRNCSNLVAIDALALAEQLGNVKAANVVLLGRLAKAMEMGEEIWVEALKQVVPARFLELNQKAFSMGYNYQA